MENHCYKTTFALFTVISLCSERRINHLPVPGVEHLGLDVVNDVDHLHLGQAQPLLGSEVVEEPDEVIDVVLGALHVEEQHAGVDEVETSDTTRFSITRHCSSLKGSFQKKKLMEFSIRGVEG